MSLAFFASRRGIVLVGVLIGVIAALLQNAGNPANMGFCVACFERDIVGSLGFHRAGVVQYLRPEIIGLVIGALLAAMVGKEFKPRAGSAPLLRFVLGMLAMIAALVFLGCPWRTLLRLAGGDGSALLGLAGLVVGTGFGSLMIRQGFSLGRKQPAPAAVGWVLPAFMVGLLVMIFWPNEASSGVPFMSSKGPGAMHAPVLYSLVAGVIVGLLVQRSRFCTTGAIRDLFLARDPHLLFGLVAIVVSATATNLVLGQFNPGFVNQPIAHNDGLWNFLSMVLAGQCFVLAGGCAGRQLILSGEGDGDAATFVLGMMVGAAVAHNFGLASSPKGISDSAPVVVICGIVLVALLGWFCRVRGPEA